MEEIKKELLIDRAESMLAIIKSEIADLQRRIKKDKETIHEKESEFRKEEEDLYIVLMDQEENEDIVLESVKAMKAEHDKDQELVYTRTRLEREQIHLIALKQDYEIYLFYLNQNEDQ